MLAKEAALHTPVQEPPAPAAQVMLMPLAMAEAGKTVEVHAIRGKDEVRRFLQNLGFAEGAQVSVVSELNGNMIVNVKGTRVAISKSMASRILTACFHLGGIIMRTLKEAKCGETVSVAKLTGEGALKRRIMDMGITKGTQIYVRKVAPLGDPVEINVRGYELSIRKSEAENILLEA